MKCAGWMVLPLKKDKSNPDPREESLGIGTYIYWHKPSADHHTKGLNLISKKEYATYCVEVEIKDME